jgi:hypothetical protein
MYQEDPHWRDCIQFYEYFHGDNGSGIGASHQTGWTGVIARAMHLFAMHGQRYPSLYVAPWPCHVFDMRLAQLGAA